MMARARVTRGMIEAGERRDRSCCPVALAVRALLPDHWRVEVGARHINIFDHAYRFVIGKRFSAAIVCRIRAFDDGEGMEPFAFRLDLPEVRQENPS